jgi:hypothetical protein
MFSKFIKNIFTSEKIEPEVILSVNKLNEIMNKFCINMKMGSTYQDSSCITHVNADMTRDLLTVSISFSYSNNSLNGSYFQSLTDGLCQRLAPLFIDYTNINKLIVNIRFTHLDTMYDDFFSEKDLGKFRGIYKSLTKNSKI